MTTINDVAERNEILQPIIDRLLYLPKEKREEFIHYLSTLNSVYNVDVQIINGIRIYNFKPCKK